MNIGQTGLISFDTAFNWATCLRAGEYQGGHDRLPRVPHHNRASALVNAWLICRSGRTVGVASRAWCRMLAAWIEESTRFEVRLPGGRQPTSQASCHLGA